MFQSRGGATVGRRYMRRLVHAAACRTSSLALLARAEELEEQTANGGVLAMLAARLQRQRPSCQSSPSTILVKIAAYERV